MGYIVCKKCGGHYQLQNGESPDDFESCQCGGQLEYVEALDDLKGSDTSLALDEHTCPNCGSPISEYSIICRNCGFKIDTEDLQPSETISDSPFEESDNIEKEVNDDDSENELDKGGAAPDLKELNSNDIIIDEKEDSSISKDLLEETIICPQCKKENDSLSNFCKFCGYALNNKSENLPVIDKLEDKPQHSKLKNCPSCGAEIQEYSIICRSCGKPLKTEPDDFYKKPKNQSNTAREDRSDDDTGFESILDDLIYILTSLDFIKSLILLGFALIFAGKLLGVFFSGIVFLFCAMVFSILSKKNIRISSEAAVLLATVGVIIILISHSSWNLSAIDLILFFFFSLFGAFLGGQFVKRGFVK